MGYSPRSWRDSCAWGTFLAAKSQGIFASDEAARENPTLLAAPPPKTIQHPHANPTSYAGYMVYGTAEDHVGFYRYFYLAEFRILNHPYFGQS